MVGKKTGGRVAGTPNKITSELRTALRDIIAVELNSLPQTLDSFEPKERLEMVIKLLPFCLPRVQPTRSNYDDPPGDFDWGFNV